MSPSPTHILSTSPSGLSMSHATISDISQLSTLWARSFHPNNPFYQALGADSPSTRAWWASAHEKAIADKEGAIFLKCTDGEKIVALGRWVRPAKVDGGVASDGYGGDGEGGVERWPEFTEGFDMELSGAFFGAMAEHREMLMGRRRHYYMELLGTDAKYKNRGAATMMLQWGCDRADEEGVECYVDSSPQALKLYQKFGWVKKAEREMPLVGDFRYTEHFLVRPAPDRT